MLNSKLIFYVQIYNSCTKNRNYLSVSIEKNDAEEIWSDQIKDAVIQTIGTRECLLLSHVDCLKQRKNVALSFEQINEIIAQTVAFTIILKNPTKTIEVVDYCIKKI